MANKALTYRPTPRWHVTAAFAAAVAIHLSAVALASLRHDARVAHPGCRFTPIEVDPGELLPPPLQAEIPPPITAPSRPPQEFIETEQSRQPILNRHPIRTIGQRPIRDAGNPKIFALFAPRPEYPYEARSRRLTGSGIAILSVDFETGFVDNVSMEQRLHDPVLDNAAISAFKRWRFKKGTVRTVRVPITFTMTGVQY